MKNRIHKIVLLFVVFIPLLFTACGGGGSGAGSITTPNKPKENILSMVYLYANRTVIQPGSVITLVTKALETSGRPAVGRSVLFTASGGRFVSTQSSTDDRGMAVATFTSDVEGEVAITASVEGYQVSKNIVFTSNVSRTPLLLVEVDSNHNGIYDEDEDYSVSQGSEIDFKVKVLNNLGFPESGILVNVSGSYISGGSAYTDDTGYTHVYTVVQGENTTYEKYFVITITASDRDNNSITSYLTFTLTEVVPEQVILTADPDTLVVGEQSVITATVIGSNGMPLQGVEVNFSADNGDITGHATTDENGEAVVVYTAPNSVSSCGCDGKITITASVNNISGEVTILVYGSLEITPPIMSVDGETGAVVSFTVTGGVPPYKVTPSNPDYLPDAFTLNNSGESITIFVPAGSETAQADYTVTDSSGATVKATLYIRGGTVGENLTVTPSGVSVIAIANPDDDVSDDLTFVITGGVPPYSMVSSREGIIASQPYITDNVFSVDPDSPLTQTTVYLMVMDSSGEVVETTVDVQ